MKVWVTIKFFVVFLHNYILCDQKGSWFTGGEVNLRNGVVNTELNSLGLKRSYSEIISKRLLKWGKGKKSNRHFLLWGKF